jgi:hypothetical protein
MAKKPLVIWFDDKGNMLDQVRPWMFQPNSGRNCKSEEGKDFDDRMDYVRLIDYGRNAARLELKSASTGREYSMFLDDFHEVIKHNKFLNNQIEGTFRFVKKGSGQAIKLVLLATP